MLDLNQLSQRVCHSASCNFKILTTNASNTHLHTMNTLKIINKKQNSKKNPRKTQIKRDKKKEKQKSKAKMKIPNTKKIVQK